MPGDSGIKNVLKILNLLLTVVNRIWTFVGTTLDSKLDLIINGWFALKVWDHDKTKNSLNLKKLEKSLGIFLF